MDTKQFIADHLNDDVHELALKYSNAKVDMTLALRQIEARQLLRKKVPSWSNNDELLFPVRLSIEQCSSEATARYKASLLSGTSFADLTGGLGVDFFFISQNFQHCDYVELNPELCELAKHNLKGSVIHNTSAEAYLQSCEPKHCLFIDPARRDNYGRKMVSVADCTPNVVELQGLMLQKAKRVMIKLSPMLDISLALKELHHIKEVHVVAVENECKELLFVMEPEFESDPVFTCVNLGTQQPMVSFTQEEEKLATATLTSEIGHFLYEPNAAVMKGGCYHLLTQRYQVQKLHRNSHLYTADQLISDFPGRIFEVDDWAVFGKKAKAMLEGVDKASIAVRNFPMTVAELRKKLKINDGDQIYLFATTLSDERKVLIKTHKIH
ncbi:MAG: SAM-dependent methyltransferase [Bacteroidales bacterium]|nr:SAM-dependent methyltransferase [Bacteroidales bacterium]